MRDLAIHGAWLTTHALRTVFERDLSVDLLELLSSEVKVLQAEIYRAHRLIEGYNLVFEREERAGHFRIRGLEILTFIIFLLTLLLWKSWFCPRRTSVEKTALAITGDLGQSSDTESSEGETRRSVQISPARPKNSGPTRPSQLGKGSRK